VYTVWWLDLLAHLLAALSGHCPPNHGPLTLLEACVARRGGCPVEALLSLIATRTWFSESRGAVWGLLHAGPAARYLHGGQWWLLHVIPNDGRWGITMTGQGMALALARPSHGELRHRLQAVDLLPPWRAQERMAHIAAQQEAQARLLAAAAAARRLAAAAPPLAPPPALPAAPPAPPPAPPRAAAPPPAPPAPPARRAAPPGPPRAAAAAPPAQLEAQL